MLNKEEIEKAKLTSEDIIRCIQRTELDGIGLTEREEEICQSQIILLMHIEQLEADNYEANNIINKYIEDRQKLIEKLEEDCKRLGNYEERTQMDSKQLFENDGMWVYAQEILEIIKKN